MKLLVHACCGPCSIMPTRLLREEGHDITVFFANSNIAPRGEYEKRLRELERYAAGQGFSVVEGAYDPSVWEREVAPIGEAVALGEPAACETVAELLDDERRQERCRACYRMRLAEAAAAAAEGGYDALSTTLAVSPYQFTDVIREELDRACAAAGVDAHFEDFRTYYDEATRISRELGMYRQNYCGCRFSVREGELTRAFIKEKRAAAKAARAVERAFVEANNRGRYERLDASLMPRLYVAYDARRAEESGEAHKEV
ncbi:MAG: epoxyqueuosine reductase QueH, partial [Eggerthellaceae bacterium]|nr:epoxyqueuosine reductase QueH [Eggerthellaceae bacterium]